MSMLTEAYDLLGEFLDTIDSADGDHPARLEVESWLKRYEKHGHDEEIRDRVRRIETRLCVMMEHLGLRPQSDGTYLTPSRHVLTIKQEIQE